MKKLLLLFLLPWLPLAAWCSDGDTFTANTVEGVAMTFMVTSEANKQCQVGVGNYSPAINSSTTGVLTIPSEANRYSVTSIGARAFRECYGLTSVTIPNSVKSIEEGAFSSCSGLTSVTIPNSVTSIGNSTFYGCSGLTSVTIPNSVTSIGGGAFNGCSGLTSITVESGNTVYDSRDNCNAIIKTETNELIAGCKNTVIPNSVTSIGDYAFSSCSGLTSVTIPNSVTSIGEWAFSCCRDLTSVTIPNSVTSIGRNSFSSCSGLTSVTIPNSVKSIEEGAFSSCSGLTSVTIPNSVTSIGTGAFTCCRALTSVAIPNSVTSIGASAFNECYGLTSVTIPNSVTSIGSFAFSYTGWYNNQSDGLLYLDNWLLDYKGTKPSGEIVIKEGTKGIANYAFGGCTGLTSVTIPNSVTSIGDDAFSGCSGLTSVTVGNPEPVDITSYTFSNRANATLHVSAGSKAAYEAADYWKDFGTIVDVAVDDVFTAKTKEGVDMSFKVTSIDPMEVQVGEGDENHFGAKAAIDKTYAGEITIPSTVTIPGTNLTFTVSKVGVNAFNGCNLMTSVEMPLTIRTIEEDVFYGCKSLKNVVLPNSIKTIPGISIGYGTSQGYAPIDGVAENIHVPSSVTWIGRYAINQCDTVVIEDGNSNLLLQDRNAKDGYYDGTFSHVKKLYVGRNTALNGSYKSDMLFCALNSTSTQLTDVIFGPLVTKAFTGWAFGYCNHVKSLTSLAKIPFASPNFSGIPQTAVLYVPLGSQQQYASADGWSRFSDIREVTEVTITMDDTEMVYAGDFDLDFSHVEGLKAYTAGDYDMATSTITLNPIQLVSAGKGVILKGAKGTYTVPCVNIEPTTTDALCGTISGRFIRNTEGENVNYAFDKDEHVFKPVDAAYGSLISRNGAYLSLPASSVSGNGNITLQFKEIVEPVPSPIAFTDPNVKAICVVNWDTDKDGELSEAEAAAVTSIGTVFRGNENIKSFDEFQYFTKVTSIEDNAFYGCSGLTSVSIPNSVTSIGESAFRYCSGVTEVYSLIEEPFGINSGVFQFWDNETQKSVFTSATLYVPKGTKAKYEATDGWKEFKQIIEVDSEESLTNKLTVDKDVYEVPAGGGTVTVVVKYDFTNVRSMQCDLSFSDASITPVVNSYGKIVITSGDLISGHIFSTGRNRILLTEYDMRIITPTSGMLFSFTVNVASTVAEGYYTGTISGIQLTEYIGGENQSVKLDDVTYKIKVGNPIEIVSEALLAEDVTIRAGQTATADICLNNETTKDFTAYQFDLVLPAGIDIAKNAKGKLDVTKGMRYEDDSQSLTVQKVEGTTGTYRVMSFSLANGIITGTEGTLLTVKLQADADMAEGEYTARMENIVMTRKDGTQIELSDATLKITVNRITMGDTNGDEIVNVTDIVEVVNCIMGHPSAGFVRAAADLNGDNIVNVTDIVMIVNIIMSDGKARSKEPSAVTDANDRLTLDGKGGDSFGLSLHNDARYVAAQMDIVLTEGQTLENVSLSKNRCGSHLLSCQQTGRNTYRVMLFSLTNEGFGGFDGSLLDFSVTGGTGGFSVENIVFVKADETQRTFDALYGQTTGIGATLNDKGQMINDNWYDLNGRKLDGQPNRKGVFIRNGKKQMK